MSAKYQLEREMRFGKIYGYPKSAINEIANSIKHIKPMKYWLDIKAGKKIPNQLIIDQLLFDFIPASAQDKQSIVLGKRVINLLDQINPKIAKYYLKLGRKTLQATADEMLKYFKTKHRPYR